MKKNNKKLKLFSLIFLILFCLYFQTVVYSAINSTMTIKGDAYARVDADVRITDFRLVSTNNGISSYEEFGKNHIVTNVELINSTSSITYYVEVTNYGNCDVGLFNITGLPSDVNYSLSGYKLKDKICDDSGRCNNFVLTSFEITLSSSNSYVGNIQLNFEFKKFNSITYSGITNKNYASSIMDGEDLNIKFISDIPNKINVYSDGIEIDRSQYFYDNASGQLVFQNVSGNLVIEKAESTLLEGKTFSKTLKDFVNGTTDAAYNSTDTNVTYIGVFVDEIPEGYSRSQFLNLPSESVSENARVKAYYDNGRVYIYSVDDIFAPSYSYSLFRGYSNLTELNINSLNTSNTDAMGAMFQDLTSLTKLDISQWNVDKVISLFYTFYGMNNLKEIYLPDFDSGKLKDLESTFGNCYSLESLDLSSWNVSNVVSTAKMFINCYHLTYLNLDGWDTSNVTNMDYMFRYNKKMVTLDLSSFNTSKVTTMVRMFGYCDNLEKIYVGDGWDTSNVTSSESMFSNSPKLPNFNSSVIDVSKAYVGDGGYLSYPPKTFNIDGVAYKYEEGMTWRDWVDSSYDTRGFVNNNDLIYTDDLMYALVYEEDNGSYTSYSWPYIDDLIDPNLVYVTFYEAGEDGEW